NLHRVRVVVDDQNGTEIRRPAQRVSELAEPFLAEVRCLPLRLGGLLVAAGIRHDVGSHEAMCCTGGVLRRRSFATKVVRLRPSKRAAACLFPPDFCRASWIS